MASNAFDFVNDLFSTRRQSTNDEFSRPQHRRESSPDVAVRPPSTSRNYDDPEATVYRRSADVPEQPQVDMSLMNGTKRLTRRSRTPYRTQEEARPRSKSAGRRDSGWGQPNGYSVQRHRGPSRDQKGDDRGEGGYSPYQAPNERDQRPQSQQRQQRAITPARDRRRSASRGRNGYESDNESVASGVSYRSTATGARRIRPRIPDHSRHDPANIIGYNGIYVLHLKPGVIEEDLREMFDEFGLIYRVVVDETWAKINYDNPQSASKAIGRYNGLHVESITADRRRLLMRFCPGHGQPPRLVNRGRPWTSKECYHWRTNGCEQAIRRCKRLHEPMCRGIDFQPWMLGKIMY